MSYYKDHAITSTNSTELTFPASRHIEILAEGTDIYLNLDPSGKPNATKTLISISCRLICLSLCLGFVFGGLDAAAQLHWLPWDISKHFYMRYGFAN